MVAADGKRIKLGDLLVKAGVISEDQLRSALAEQKKWGGKLGRLLVDMRILSEDLLVKALSKQLGLPRVDFEGLVVQETALQKLDAEYAQARQVLPIAFDVGKNLLVVAMAEPDNLAGVDELAFRTGARIKVAIAGERALAAAIRRHYFGEAVSQPGEAAAESGREQNEPMQLTSPLGDGEVPIEAGGAAPLPAATIDQRIQRLEAWQQKEVQVLKAIVELLIEKGYLSSEEYRQRVGAVGP
jgi:type IV pilus assembly protein PilB